MQSVISSPKFIMIALALIAVVAIPLTIIQVQNQQNTQQEASEIETLWLTDQSVESVCPPDKSSVKINVSFSNTEPNRSSLAMKVIATDQQTGQKVDLGVINGGQTKTGVIDTKRETINSGSVKFALTWADGHSGVDSRAASYKAIDKCVQPTPTPTRVPDAPTPTVCPTLGPVQNVRIECPNCP